MVLGGGGDPRTVHVDLMAVGLSSTRIPHCCPPKSELLALFLGMGGEKMTMGSIFSPLGNKIQGCGLKEQVPANMARKQGVLSQRSLIMERQL